jgi:DNA-binding GntR family transcriptional regulator
MIPSITTLSQQYGVAVSTVRRSLGVLKDEGLIRTRPSWGTFVVPPAERPKS